MFSAASNLASAAFFEWRKRPGVGYNEPQRVGFYVGKHYKLHNEVSMDFFQTLLVIYLLVVNIVGFAMMGMDKRKAIKGAWRIPEASLFLVAIIGGSVGSILGMETFRHKTKHWYFKYGMPAILILQIGIGLFFVNNVINNLP